MDAVRRPSRQRRWPLVVIGLATVGVLVAAGVFVATREPTVPVTERPTPPTTTLRACVQKPAAVEGTEGAAEPPDGTYLVLISPVIGVAAVDVAVVEGGTALEFSDVPVAEDVSITGQGPAAITVRDGAIVGFDPQHATWDDPLGRGGDPCTPHTECELSEDPIPHTWPGGIDGLLGETLAEVPANLATALAKWGIDVDPAAFVLTSDRCAFSATIGGDLTLQMYLGLTEDGYVLSAATTDQPEDDVAGVSYTAQGESVQLSLAPVFRDRYPEATVDAVVRFGDRSEKATAPVADESITVTIARRMNQRGSFVLKYTSPDGTIRRLVAGQLPAGNSAAG